MLLWPLCVLSCVFLARMMSAYRLNTITIFTFHFVHDSPVSLFLVLVFLLFKYPRDGADRLMNDLEELLRLYRSSFGIGKDN